MRAGSEDFQVRRVVIANGSVQVGRDGIYGPEMGLKVSNPFETVRVYFAFRAQSAERENIIST
jgi:hypothetical protein